MSLTGLLLSRSGFNLSRNTVHRLFVHRAFHGAASRQGSQSPRVTLGCPPVQRTRIHTPYLTASLSFWSAKSTPEPQPSNDMTQNPEEAIPSSSTENLLGLEGAPSLDPTDAVVDAISPLQYGDFASMGLVNWNPAGLVRWTFELLNVSTGMTWFWTIVAGTVIWRLVALPFFLKTGRATAKLAPIREDVQRITTETRDAMRSGDKEAIMRSNEELKALYASAGYNPLSPVVSSVAQATISIGTFFAVKGICEHPVVQLTQSGFAMIPDLTAAPQSMLLPAVLVGVMQVQIHFMLQDMERLDQQVPIKIPPVFWHGLGFLPLFVMNHLPVGVLVSLTSTGLFLILQVLLLRQPGIRRFIGLPPRAPLLPPANRTALPNNSQKIIENGAQSTMSRVEKDKPS